MSGTITLNFKAANAQQVTTAERTAVIFRAGRLVYDTDLNKLYVGDGVTAGGIPIETPVQTTRVTSTPYTITNTDFAVYFDTDSLAITGYLPEGSEGRSVRLINCGSSGYDVTVTPYGAELLDGMNSSKTLSDGSIVDLVYNATEGWR